MKIPQCIFIWIAMLMLSGITVLSAHGNERGVPRLALIATGDDRAETIAELVEARLSSDRDLALLDRRMVGNLLDEQEWLSQGSLTTDGALRAGILLGCDLFAELRFHAGAESSATRDEVVSLIAFDAVTGIRLVDRTLSADRLPEDLAEGVATALASMARGWLNPGDGGVLTVSIGTIRNVNLKAGHSHLPAVLQPLIERNLLAADVGVALLERQRLDFVNREAGLSKDRRDRLLASMVLIDVDMMQGDRPDDVLIRATLKSWGGNVLATFEQTGSATALHDRAHRMTAVILESLDMKTATGYAFGDDIRQMEGRRFFDDADQHALRNEWQAAAQAAEIAVALNPAHHYSLILLFDSLGRVATQQARIGDWTNTLNTLQRQVDVLEDLNSLNCTPHVWRTEAWALLIGSKKTLSPVTRQRLEQTRHRVRTIIMKRPDIRNWGAIVIWVPSPDAWLEDMLPMIDKDLPEPLKIHVLQSLIRSRSHGFMPMHVRQKEWRRSGQEFIWHLASDGKQRLLDFYLSRVDGGGVRDCLAALRYAHLVSGELPDARADIKMILDRLIALAQDAQPAAIQEIVVCIDEILTDQPDPVGLYVAALLRLVSDAERRQLVFPEAYVLLDRLDADVTPPGGHLMKAATLLRDADSVLRPPVRAAQSAREPSSKHGCLRDIGHVFKERYQSDMPGSEDDWALPDPDEIWEKEETLFTVTNLQIILTMEIHDDHLYILQGEEKRWNHGIFELIHLDLLTGKTSSLGKLRIQTELSSGYILNMMRNNRVSINETGILYPAVNSIIHYDIKGNVLRSVASESGLPNVYYDAVISVGEAWYLGATRFEPGEEKAFPYGDGMLLRYTPSQGSYDILAASARKEILSELDNCNPYRITDFYYDRRRHRLLFGVLSSRYDSDRRYAIHTSAVWSYDIETGEIQRASPRLSNAHAPRRVSENVYLVQSSFPRRLTFWIPGTDKYETLSFAAMYNGRGHYDGITHLMPTENHSDRMAILHDRIYLGWLRMTIWPYDEQEIMVPTAPESVIREWEQRNYSSRLVPGAIKSHGETLLFATPSRVIRMTPRRPFRIVAPEMKIALSQSRAIAGNPIEVQMMLPKCDEIRWGLRQRKTNIERISVTGPGHLDLSIPIPSDCPGIPVNDDTVVIWAYHQGKQVAQGSAAIEIHSPYSPASMRNAFSEAIYGIVETPRSDGLATLLMEAQPGLFTAQSVADLVAAAWDVAIVDGGGIAQHGDSGRETLLAFLVEQNRRVLLTGVKDRNPFLPSWAISHHFNNPSTLKETNHIVAVDRDHGMLREHEAADWLTVNDWNQVPAIIPMAGGDDRPMNLRPIYADGVSGAPFIVELFPPDGGRLLCIPFDMPVAMRTEPYAGYLLYRALQYLGQNDEPQWRDAAYRENPATERWLQAIGVAAPHAIGEQDVPDRIDQVLIFRSDSIDAPLDRWLRAGGTAIRLTNERGLAGEPPANDRYRGLLRGVAMPLIADYAAVLDEDEQAWQALLPAEYSRRPVIPGILDEVNLGAGRLLVLAVPDAITPPARNLLSILMTNCEVRLGP